MLFLQRRTGWAKKSGPVVNVCNFCIYDGVEKRSIYKNVRLLSGTKVRVSVLVFM